MIRQMMKKLMPRHVKRLLFCGSVFSHIATYYHIKPDAVRLRKLNAALKLARRDLSLEAPSGWSQTLWVNLPEPPIDDEKIKAYIETIIKAIPEWLVYGRRDDIAKDLERILNLIFHDADFKSGKFQDAETIGSPA